MSFFCSTFAADLIEAVKFHRLHTVWGTLLFLLCPLFARAEYIYTPHDFQTMYSKSELVLTNSNTTGRTALVGYQCSGSEAKFWKDHVSNSKISIRLPKYGSTVTTTKINELYEMVVGVLPDDESRANVKVVVSKDSITWSAPLSGDSISYSDGSITITLPRNNYYVRIYNTVGTKDASLTSIFYYQEHCNCFVYEP